MDDNAEGPSTAKKQKIEDGEPEKVEWCSYLQNFIFHKHVSLLETSISLPPSLPPSLFLRMQSH